MGPQPPLGTLGFWNKKVPETPEAAWEEGKVDFLVHFTNEQTGKAKRESGKWEGVLEQRGNATLSPFAGLPESEVKGPLSK